MVKEVNSNNGHEAQTESNAISNMSFHCNKYQGQKIKFVHTNCEEKEINLWTIMG